jgi:hypothetical protein
MRAAVAGGSSVVFRLSWRRRLSLAAAAAAAAAATAFLAAAVAAVFLAAAAAFLAPGGLASVVLLVGGVRPVVVLVILVRLAFAGALAVLDVAVAAFGGGARAGCDVGASPAATLRFILIYVCHMTGIYF